jgi:hypothetical protein
MKNACKQITIILAAAACLSPLSALAMEPMAATIKISGGGVYDYVIIGESLKATDGFDNAYDTLSPGDSLNNVYINSYFSHPEWGAAKAAFRGDIRSLKEKQEWNLSIASTLPFGTPLTVELQAGLNVLPQGLQLSIRDSGNTTTANLIGGHLSLTSPGQGNTAQLIITAEQPAGAPVTPPPVVTKADGDVDGDGHASINDAIKVLRMSLGLDISTNAAKVHGDMDGDGKLTIRDALMLIRKVVGLN